MDLEKFEAQYRQEMDEALNKLQTVMLLLAELEAKTGEVGHSIQSLSQTVEAFLNQQKQRNSEGEMGPDI